MKRARDVRDQLEGLMERVEIEKATNAEDHDAIRKAIAAGFFYHTAKLQKSGSYRTVKNAMTVDIHPSSGLAKAEVRTNHLLVRGFSFRKGSYRMLRHLSPCTELSVGFHSQAHLS